MFGSHKHTCGVDMWWAYAIGVLNSREDTLKVHMYWLNVQGLRVKAFVLFVVRCLLFVVCCLMFVDYRKFLSFRFHWAVLACLRWSLGTLGLPWVPLDGHWGSICHLWGPLGRLWGVIGLHLSPLGVYWGAFGGRWRSLWVSLCDHFGSLWFFFCH